MNKSILFLLALIIPLSGFCQQATPQLTQEDVYMQEILKKLQSIRGRQISIRNAEIRTALQKLESVINSSGGAAAFYEDAVKATRYAGQANDSKNFEEWRRKSVQEIRTAQMLMAIQVHLRYLVLALKWSSTENKVALMPEIRGYLRGLQEAEKLFHRSPPLLDDGKNFIAAPISASMFVSLLKIGTLLPGATTWEPIPGNIGGIFEKSIRPELRKEKRKELIDTWNEQIQLEADRVTNQQLKLDIDKFNAVTRPQLMWQCAEDMVLLGNTKQAYMQMISIIEANPTHANQEKWLDRLEELIAKQKAEAAPQPSVEAAPEVSATPVPTLTEPAPVATPVAPVTSTLPAATPATPAHP
ncbi:MAG: hypothetical protein ABIP97_12625 [Chthoniobacterales bacterium]